MAEAWLATQNIASDITLQPIDIMVVIHLTRVKFFYIYVDIIFYIRYYDNVKKTRSA